MKPLLALMLSMFALTFVLAAQQPPDPMPDPPSAPDPSRHDQYASDPHAYCLQWPPIPGDDHGHECHCAMVCEQDADGNEQVIEQSDCELWCTRRLCRCHVDHSCPVHVAPAEPTR